MSIQLELWHLILLLLAFFGLVGAFGKILLDQIEKRLAERFASQEKQRAEDQASQEKQRAEDQKHLDAKFAGLESAAREESSQWARVERELLALKAELPREYVRREDYIRNQTILEMKIDKVFGKLELLQIQGGRND